MKRWLLMSLLALLLAFTAACGSGDDNGASEAPGSDAGTETPGNGDEPVVEEDDFDKEVTLTLYSVHAGINSDEDLEDVFLNNVQKAYPTINIERLTDISMEDIIVTGEIPDIIAAANPRIFEILDLGLGTDLSELAKKANIDFSNFEPAVMEVIDEFGPNGELFAIPYSLNQSIMLYNKDIFDDFGVEYPHDEMYWDEVLELHKQITRTHEGQEYIGVDPGRIDVRIRQLSLPVVEDGKPVFDTPEMRSAFELHKEIYDVPGSVTGDAKYGYGINFFMREQRLAMMPYWIAATQSRVPTMDETGINWDLTSYPQIRGREGLARETDFHSLMVPPKRENMDAIERVIKTVVSQEAQEAMNNGSRLTILNDQEMRLNYSSDAKSFEGKNLAGVFKVSPAPAPPSTKYDSEIYKVLREAERNVVIEGWDINTALRDAEDKAVQVIKEIDGN